MITKGHGAISACASLTIGARQHDAAAAKTTSFNIWNKVSLGKNVPARPATMSTLSEAPAKDEPDGVLVQKKLLSRTG
jgi:hypothetical protein